MKPADTPPRLAPLPLPRVEPSDRVGAAVPQRADPGLEGADLTNVIVLAHRRSSGDVESPVLTVDESLRPAPVAGERDRSAWTALIAGAVLLHLGLVLIFLRDPVQVPSLALDSISVDIVLGGQTEAGVAQTASPQQSAASPPAENTPQQPQAADPQTDATEPAKPELRPRIEPQASEPQRDDPRPEQAQTATAEPDPAPTPEPDPNPPLAEAEPAPKLAETEEAKPAEAPVATEPPPTHKPAETQKPTEKPREPAKPSPPRIAASQSGVGVGSSRATQDWASLVSAHLARNKRYPADALARGIGGTAIVSFTLDGGGNVTAVRLVRSSRNASLDRESVDLVRRAAPFPAPPQGKASITVPVNFSVRTAR